MNIAVLNRHVLASSRKHLLLNEYRMKNGKIIVVDTHERTVTNILLLKLSLLDVMYDLRFKTTNVSQLLTYATLELSLT